MEISVQELRNGGELAYPSEAAPATYQTHAGAPVKRKRNPDFGNH
jgi:hypothetical protein